MTLNVTYQVVVYGSTEGAVMAAVSAAINGASVCLVAEPPPGFTTTHIGGSMVNGLGATDGGHYFTHIVGHGPTGVFFQKNTGRYGSRSTVYSVEPHGAEETFKEMLAEYGVDAYVGNYLSTVQLSSTTVTSITDSAGNIFNGTNFIDMTYEGDLAAACGVTMEVGREQNNYYVTTSPPGGAGQWVVASEPIAGFNPSSLFGWTSNFVAVNPYVSGSSGPLLDFADALPATAIGGADSRVQAYGFRLCMTQKKTYYSAIAKPANYDTALIQLYTRGLNSGSSFGLGTIPNGKFDMNYDYVDWSGDTIPSGAQAGNQGGPQGWATGAGAFVFPLTSGAATAVQTNRALIAQAMYTQQATWLWYLANDPGAPSLIQADVIPYGLSSDEFRDNTVYQKFWPRLPYIREARRMQGQYVMTQTDVQNPAYVLNKTDVVSMGCYSMDCHTVGQYPQLNGATQGYILDSNAQVPVLARSTLPYQVPYRAYLPLATQTVNLLVGGAASFSHVAFCSFRIVHTWMNAGVACGTAAALSAVNSHPLQYYETTGLATLQSTLTSMGQVLTYTPP